MAPRYPRAHDDSNWQARRWVDFGRALTKLLEADVRSAIVPFTRPDTFDPAAQLPDGQP